MPLGKAITATAALIFATTPIVAQAADAPQPASEEIAGASSLADSGEHLGWVVAAAIAAIFLYILIQTGDDDDDDDVIVPVSP